jgi:N-ethylmaleimide reductase
LSEIIAAVSKEVPVDRIGLRVSPTSKRRGMGDEDPGALAAEIGRFAGEAGLAYIHLIEPIASGFMEKPVHPVMVNLRAAYHGAVIQNGSFDAQSAEDLIACGQADVISFGRRYIANPDLVRRIRERLPLAEGNLDYAYVGDDRGYTDYPRYA